MIVKVKIALQEKVGLEKHKNQNIFYFRSLRQEKIYVSYEKKQLQSLNEAVSDAGRRLSQGNMDIIQS